MDGFREVVIDNPLVTFTTLLLVSLTLPPLFERLRLPGLVQPPPAALPANYHFPPRLQPWMAIASL